MIGVLLVIYYCHDQFTLLFEKRIVTSRIDLLFAKRAKNNDTDIDLAALEKYSLSIPTSMTLV